LYLATNRFSATMISEKLREQITRGEKLMPLAVGASRKIATTEGDLVLQRTDSGLQIIEPLVSDMPLQFSRVVVINRPDRPEKKLALITHLREIGWPFREPEWHVAIPGNQLPPPPSDWKSTRNIWAGNQSHCQIIRESWERGDESVLIMEDDCLYLPDFLARVRRFLGAAPADWGMLYLGGRFADYSERRRECGQIVKQEHWGGGEIRPPRRELVRDSVYRVCGLNNIESYAVHRRFMQEAIRVLQETRFHADVALNLVQWTAKTYHMIPPIATQRAGWSDNFNVHKAGREARLATNEQEGAVILSTGVKRRILAANAAASFRRNNPALGLHLFSDTQWPGYGVTECHGTGFASRALKTRLLADSPFRAGVILDDDTTTIRQLPPFREILGDFDLAMAPDRFARIGDLLASRDSAVLRWLSREEAEYTLENYPACGDATHWNSGVIFFRQTSAVKDLAKVWHEEWRRFGKIDQIALFRALQRTGLKVKTLPGKLHFYSDNCPLPADTIIAHTIGKKWNIREWLIENKLPVVAPPSVGCCGGGMPSVGKQVAGIARAAGEVFADLVTGRNPAVSREERARRLEICKSCVHRNDKRCSLCGCLLAAVSWLNQDKCEAGKWPKILS
jgi:hypothetical protein